MPDTLTPIRTSYSSLTEHRKCPQAWNYQYLQGLVPDEAGPVLARDLGSWWHFVRLADAIYRGSVAGTLVSVPEKVKTGEDGPVLWLSSFEPGSGEFPLYRIKGDDEEPIPLVPAQAATIVARYWASLNGETQQMWTETYGSTLSEHLQGMDARWRDRWAEETAKERPLGVEVDWKRELPGTSDEVEGTVDEVYLDTTRNLVIVRDSKTGKNLAATDAADDLMDSQLHFYAWGVSPLVKEWGHSVDAIGYDRIRSTAPKAPALTQTGTLSKSVTDYDLSTYLAFVGEGVEWGEPDTFYQSGKKKGEPKFGTYTVEPSVVERLSTPALKSVWAQRTRVPVNLNVVRAHLQAAVDTYESSQRTIARVEKSGEAPRNMTRMGCSWCDYLGLCRAQMMGGPDGEYPLEDFGLREGEAPLELSGQKH